MLDIVLLLHRSPHLLDLEEDKVGDALLDQFLQVLLDGPEVLLLPLLQALVLPVRFPGLHVDPLGSGSGLFRQVASDMRGSSEVFQDLRHVLHRDRFRVPGQLLLLLFLLGPPAAVFLAYGAAGDKALAEHHVLHVRQPLLPLWPGSGQRAGPGLHLVRHQQVPLAQDRSVLAFQDEGQRAGPGAAQTDEAPGPRVRVGFDGVPDRERPGLDLKDGEEEVLHRARDRQLDIPRGKHGIAVLPPVPFLEAGAVPLLVVLFVFCSALFYKLVDPPVSGASLGRRLLLGVPVVHVFHVENGCQNVC